MVWELGEVVEQIKYRVGSSKILLRVSEVQDMLTALESSETHGHVGTWLYADHHLT